jgi:hypothetical protein
MRKKCRMTRNLARHLYMKYEGYPHSYNHATMDINTRYFKHLCFDSTVFKVFRICRKHLRGDDNDYSI